MDQNPLAAIAKTISIDLGDISKLSRDEKIGIRNQIILALVGTNHSVDEVAKIFTISPRQVYNILEDEYNKAKDWYKQFPAKIRIAAFKINSAAVFGELERMKAIREKVKKDGDYELEFDMSDRIARLQIQYDKMLTEGVTLDSIRSQADEIVDLALKFASERSTLHVKMRELEIQLSDK